MPKIQPTRNHKQLTLDGYSSTCPGDRLILAPERADIRDTSCKDMRSIRRAARSRARIGSSRVKSRAARKERANKREYQKRIERIASLRSAGLNREDTL